MLFRSESGGQSIRCGLGNASERYALAKSSNSCPLGAWLLAHRRESGHIQHRAKGLSVRHGGARSWLHAKYDHEDGLRHVRSDRESIVSCTGNIDKRGHSPLVLSAIP
jgi:hypothetical protein